MCEFNLKESENLYIIVLIFICKILSLNFVYSDYFLSRNYPPPNALYILKYLTYDGHKHILNALLTVFKWHISLTN